MMSSFARGLSLLVSMFTCASHGYFLVFMCRSNVIRKTLVSKSALCFVCPTWTIMGLGVIRVQCGLGVGQIP